MNPSEPTHRKAVVADPLKQPIVTILLERAVTEEQQLQGLMHRTHLGELEGMVFISEYDGYWGVWMKDTPLSLDILFVNRYGRINTIHHAVEPNRMDIHYYSDFHCRFVIEMNAGFCTKYNIMEGHYIIPIDNEEGS